MKVPLAAVLLALSAVQSASGQNAPAATAPAASSSTAESDTPVSLSRTPAVVKTTINATVGKDKIDNIIRHKDDEGSIYAVEITKPDATTRDILVESDGTLISVEVVLAEIPQTAQTAIKAQAGSLKIVNIDKTFDEEQPAYVVEVGSAAGEKSFTIAEDGKLERADITIIETPPAVNLAITKQAGKDKIETIEKVFDIDEISYDVTVLPKDGVEKTFTIGPEGALESMDVALADTPKAVQTIVVATLGKGKLVSAVKNFDPNGVTYDFVMKPPLARERDFSVNENGSLLSEQVFLEQLPVTVRNTINEQIGDGKVLHIDKSYEPGAGGMTYEVSGYKDGKEIDFSTGPRGKFLGLDN